MIRRCGEVSGLAWQSASNPVGKPKSDGAGIMLSASIASFGVGRVELTGSTLAAWFQAKADEALASLSDVAAAAAAEGETAVWQRRSDEALKAARLAVDGAGKRRASAPQFIRDDNGNWLQINDDAADSNFLLDYGRNADGYFNGERFCAQAALTMSIATFWDANADFAFMTDHSGAHAKFHDNALQRQRNEGGRQHEDAAIDSQWLVYEHQWRACFTINRQARPTFGADGARHFHDATRRSGETNARRRFSKIDGCSAGFCRGEVHA